MTDYVTISFDATSLDKVDKLADELFDGNRSQAVRHMVKRYGKN